MRRTLLLCCLPLAGCLPGLGAGDPTPIRYFSAEPARGTESVRVVDGLSLRLRRVTAAQHLRERMVWRASDVEYGFYETRRWTEQPLVWLESALSRELFEQHAVARSERASGHALDVHLVGFEEVLSPHGARVAIDLRLVQAGAEVLLERRVERRVAIDRDDPAAVARAATRALGEAVAEAADAIVAALMADGD